MTWILNSFYSGKYSYSSFSILYLSLLTINRNNEETNDIKTVIEYLSLKLNNELTITGFNLKIYLIL